VSDWYKKAACREMPTAIFFPTQGQSQKKPREICGGCPVVDPCLDSALEEESGRGLDYRSGIRGGLDRNDRLVLARLVDELGIAS